MQEVVNYFQEHKYVYLPDFLDKDNCQELTKEFYNLIDKGLTVQDPQCPLSESIHGAKAYDSILEELTPNIEYAVGKKLYPTYAYARLYRPSEVLHPHVDRPACEYSVTITLGIGGKPWPIYMADEDTTKKSPTIVDGKDGKYYVKNIKEVEMAVGDAVVYKGLEKVHWRSEFEGEWQVQVFLHYVDAHGPYADQKYDGRENLSHHTTTEGISRPNEPVWLDYWALPEAIPDYACDSLIKSLEPADSVPAQTYDGLETDIRKAERYSLPTFKGIGATLTGIAFNANSEMWNFDITRSNQVDYLKYDKDGHYLPHIDTFLVTDEPEYRKLTVLLFLNDDFEGGRLYLQLGHKKVYPPQEKGTVLVFPSWILHCVEPVTKGFRRSIVTWITGPWFK